MSGANKTSLPGWAGTAHLSMSIAGAARRRGRGLSFRQASVIADVRQNIIAGFPDVGHLPGVEPTYIPMPIPMGGCAPAKLVEFFNPFPQPHVLPIKAFDLRNRRVDGPSAAWVIVCRVFQPVNDVVGGHKINYSNKAVELTATRFVFVVVVVSSLIL